MGVKWLGVEKSFDDSRPVGVLIAGHEAPVSDFEGFVAVIPYRDRE